MHVKGYQKKILLFVAWLSLFLFLLYVGYRVSAVSRNVIKPTVFVLADSTASEPDSAAKKIMTAGDTIRNGFFNPGFTQVGWWVYVPLKKPVQEKIWLQVANPHINKLDLYLFRENRWQKTEETGDYFPFHKRAFDDPEYWFPVEAGNTAVLLHLNKKGESLNAPVRLVPDSLFGSYLSDEKVFIGVFMGWFLFLVLLNIFLWVSLKENIHFFYLLYVTASAGWILIHWGVAFRLFWPMWPEFANKARPLFSNISFLFFLELTKRYFTLPQARPVFVGSIRITQFLLLFSSVGLLLTSLPESSMALRYVYLTTMNIIWLVSICLVILNIWYGRHQGELTYYFLGGTGILSIFIVILLFSEYNLDADWLYFIKKYGAPLGLLAESTILSFGLTQRYNLFKKEKERVQRALEEEKHAVANKIIQTQEEERNRLARELHDGLGGLLGSIRISAHSKLKEQKAEQEWIGEQLDHAITDLRNIAHDLMPVNLQEQGLKRILEKTIARWQADEKLHIRFSADLNKRYRLPVEAAIYRIVSELMHNIKKHAGATEVGVDLWEDLAKKQIVLLVEDNGTGFDSSKTDGLGWKNIRHRVQYMEGKVNIDSNSNGTTVIIEIPLPNEST
jgi:signal transduction histidine kinase